MGTTQATSPQAESANKLTQAKIAELKMKHGAELFSIDVDDGTYVFRRPSRPEWRRYLSSLSSDKRGADKSLAHEQIAVDCLVFPSSDNEDVSDGLRLRTLFEHKPGLPVVIAAELGELAGASDSVQIKKL